ncbi:HU family DNA-binding protein [Candidatus Uhrbacteria bacterium]|nr:MAG: HU family DNA-binding protein [Candidatus Uhrbacteria bacterium]
MNKAELINHLSDKVGVTKKQAEDMVEAFVDVVTNTLKSGGEVNIAGFGAFMAKTRAARMGVNPQNPSEKIQIGAVTVPKFKAGKGLKDALKHTGAAASSAPAPATPSTPEAPSVPSM